MSERVDTDARQVRANTFSLEQMIQGLQSEVQREIDEQCEKEGAAAYPKLKSRWNAELPACRAEHRGRRRTLN